MKLFHLLAITSFFAINNLVAQTYQSGSITTNDKQILEGRIFIDNTSKNVLLKKSGDINTYSFSSIATATIGRLHYSKNNFKNEVYLASQLTSGKASIYALSNDNFALVKSENELHFFNLKNDKSKIPGILSLLFNDCNSVREAINKTDYFTEKSLTELTNTYNNCESSTYTPTESEISSASAFNTDSFRFYGGLLAAFNTTDVNGFASTNTTGFGVGIGLAASPAFLGNLKGNIYFDFDVNLLFNGSEDFKNGNTPLNYKVNNYRFSIGMEYVFNKNGSIQPFLGVGYAFSFDQYDGNLGTINFKDDSREFFFTPKAGILYQLKNENLIGLTVSYIPEYTSDLSFIFNKEINDLVVKTESITLGLSYYF